MKASISLQGHKKSFTLALKMIGIRDRNEPYSDLSDFNPSTTVVRLNVLMYAAISGKLIFMFSSVAPLGIVANRNGGL